MRKKYALHHMTWKEIEEAFKQDPIVLIPLGSMEEHGPHSITGDFLAASEIVKQIAERTGAYYLPVIPFGYSELFRNYPGTISLSPNTLYGLLIDIFESLMEHGVTKMVIFNGHTGNSPIIGQVARTIKRERGIMVASINIWQSIPMEFKKHLYGNSFNPSGHGGEPLTSVMLHLYPKDMRMDMLAGWRNQEGAPEWEGFRIHSPATVETEDIQFQVYLNMEEVSQDGILGNPLAASAERGEAIVGELVRRGVALVEKFTQANTIVK